MCVCASQFASNGEHGFQCHSIGHSFAFTQPPHYNDLSEKELDGVRRQRRIHKLMAPGKQSKTIYGIFGADIV